MARWFRSEPMEYVSLIVNEDAAHDCLGELGNLGVIQFTDVSISSFIIALHPQFMFMGFRHIFFHCAMSHRRGGRIALCSA
jgi:hypothetical protein